MTHPLILSDAERIASRVDLSPLKKKRVLVAGATGLIGTTLCAVLRDRCACVHQMRKGDSIEAYTYWQTYEVIIHAAGYSAPATFTDDRAAPIATGAGLTAILLPKLSPGGTFLFLSSSEIYSGAAPPHRETDIGTVTPTHPRAAYVFGKLTGETICHVFRAARGTDAKIARVSLAYGPGTKRGDTRVLNQFIEQALTRHAISLRDSGGALRSYCYVSDTVEMLLNVLLHGKQAVYNVGGQSMVSVNELAMMIGELTGSSVDFPNTPPDTSAPAAVKLDIGRYADEFGSPDFVPLREGLGRTIEFQRGLYA